MNERRNPLSTFPSRRIFQIDASYVRQCACNQTFLMKLKCLFFASAREITGVPSIEVDLENDSTMKDLLHEIGRIFPELKKNLTSVSQGDDISRYSIALNNQYIRENTNLKDGDKVAFLPPISGG